MVGGSHTGRTLRFWLDFGCCKNLIFDTILPGFWRTKKFEFCSDFVTLKKQSRAGLSTVFVRIVRIVYVQATYSTSHAVSYSTPKTLPSCAEDNLGPDYLLFWSELSGLSNWGMVRAMPLSTCSPLTEAVVTSCAYDDLLMDVITM